VAIIFSPGQVVAQPDWEALVRQHGGDKPAVRRSRTEAEIKAAALAGEDDPAAMQNPIYRSYLEDGSYVEYRTAPNGTDYQIVDYKPSATFTQAQTKAAAAAPENQTPQQQNEVILNQQRAKNAALPPGQDPRYETDQERATRADATIKAQGAAAETARKEAEAKAEANKPKVVPGTLNTTSPNVAAEQPDGSIKWVPNPNYQKPNAQPISIPGNPRYIWWDDGPGTTPRREKNPDYVKPSKLIPHPSDPTKMVNVTEDDAGNPVILPVNDQTVIKPADLPVLQAKYGEIAQGLGALAQDLNSRYARGEITEKQKNDAFTAAHQQASTQVAEINSILDTSKAIWSGELTQRGQSLNETQSRRSYAQGIFDRSAATGMGIATSAGPGHGREIAAGVGALMNIGQQYAQGMGGFKESPEIPLPAALQQARGIGLPGYGGPAPGPPGAPPAPSAGGPNAIGVGAIGAIPAPGAPPAPPLGISNTTDAGGVPRVKTPASATNAPPMMPQAAPPGQNPLPWGPAVGEMGAHLQGAQHFAGSPVAAGGLGVYDPTPDVQQMIGDGADPTWAEAVRRAAAEVSQPGYAWQRFQQPASRVG